MSHAVLVGRAYHPAADPHPLTLGGGQPVRIGRRGTIQLWIGHWYRVERIVAARPTWLARTTGYDYRLLDRDGHPVLAFHWHPTGRSPVIDPHLHIETPTPHFDLSKVHIPTGVISFADVVWCAITQLGVEPLRPDWSMVLQHARTAQDEPE